MIPKSLELKSRIFLAISITALLHKAMSASHTHFMSFSDVHTDFQMDFDGNPPSLRANKVVRAVPIDVDSVDTSLPQAQAHDGTESVTASWPITQPQLRC